MQLPSASREAVDVGTLLHSLALVLGLQEERLLVGAGPALATQGRRPVSQGHPCAPFTTLPCSACSPSKHKKDFGPRFPAFLSASADIVPPSGALRGFSCPLLLGTVVTDYFFSGSSLLTGWPYWISISYYINTIH